MVYKDYKHTPEDLVRSGWVKVNNPLTAGVFNSNIVEVVGLCEDKWRINSERYVRIPCHGDILSCWAGYLEPISATGEITQDHLGMLEMLGYSIPDKLREEVENGQGKFS